MLVILADDPVAVQSVANITHHPVKESAGWRVAGRSVKPLLGSFALTPGIRPAGRRGLVRLG